MFQVKIQLIADSATDYFNINLESGMTSITTNSTTDTITINTPTPTLQQVTTAGNTTSKQIVSTLADGTAPLSVTSTTLVNNLNADRVDGLHFRVNTGNIRNFN